MNYEKHMQNPALLVNCLSILVLIVFSIIFLINLNVLWTFRHSLKKYSDASTDGLYRQDLNSDRLHYKPLGWAVLSTSCSSALFLFASVFLSITVSP